MAGQEIITAHDMTLQHYSYYNFTAARHRLYSTEQLGAAQKLQTGQLRVGQELRTGQEPNQSVSGIRLERYRSSVTAPGVLI